MEVAILGCKTCRRAVRMMKAGADDAFPFTSADDLVDRSRSLRQGNVHRRLNVSAGGWVGLPAKGRKIFAIDRRDARQLFGLCDRHFERGVVELVCRRRTAFLVNPYGNGRGRILAPAAGGKPVGGKSQMREVLAPDADFRVVGFGMGEQLLADRL